MACLIQTGVVASKTENHLLKANDDSQPLADFISPRSGMVEMETNVIGERRNQQQRFGPCDLMALLKSLEKEIDTYEVLLAEEIEKRKKYRVRLILYSIPFRCPTFHDL